MVTDDAGDDWFVYHAWIGPASNIEIDPPGRVICIDKIVSCRYKCQPFGDFGEAPSHVPK